MAIKQRNKAEINKYLKNYVQVIEKALLFNLGAYVAELENHAKLSAEYKDQTSNLKSSIGGVLLKNGKPIKYEGFSGKGQEGTKTGKVYINELIQNYQTGYAILIVAGMNYAAYVEDIYNKNVLKKTELKMRSELPILISKLKQRL